MKRITLLVLFAGLLSSTAALAQNELGPVFTLGENEQAYEELSREYSQSLLVACDNNMQVAFEKWLGMMQQMEAYADKINFNLKGVSVWFHVFWDTDGNIDHIGFLLRPNSRNVPAADIQAFLSSFIRQYDFPVTSGQKFSHYTGATFPTFSERSGDK